MAVWLPLLLTFSFASACWVALLALHALHMVRVQAKAIAALPPEALRHFTSTLRPPCASSRCIVLLCMMKIHKEQGQQARRRQMYRTSRRTTATAPGLATNAASKQARLADACIRARRGKK